jgi:hypothetical protein
MALIVSAGAAALGVFLLAVGQQPVVYDAEGYYHLAVLIAHNGLFGYSVGPGAADGALPTLLQVKPNGYPFFLALVGLLSTYDLNGLRGVVFCVQLVTYLVVCRVAAHRLGSIFQSPRIQLAVFAATALNVLLLIHATEMLSDLLSTSLVYLAVVLSLPRPEQSTAVSHRDLPASFLLASVATVVRSANVTFLAALTLIWFLRWYWFGDLRWRFVPAVIVLAATPFVPQVVNNYLGFGSLSPFVARNEYAGDLGPGAASLKYITVVIPGQNPQWIYANPFLTVGPGTTLDVVLQSQPLGYAATLALHGFAVLDQDYPFPYVTDLRPWYRWPVSIANYVFLGLGAAGLYLGLRASSAARGDPRRFAFIATGLACAACVAVYLAPHVENRYSMPVYPLLTLSVVSATGRALRVFRTDGARRLLLPGVGIAAYVAGSAAVSNWLQTLQQALPVK